MLESTLNKGKILHAHKHFSESTAGKAPDNHLFPFNAPLFSSFSLSLFAPFCRYNFVALHFSKSHFRPSSFSLVRFFVCFCFCRHTCMVYAVHHVYSTNGINIWDCVFAYVNRIFSLFLCYRKRFRLTHRERPVFFRRGEKLLTLHVAIVHTDINGVDE